MILKNIYNHPFWKVLGTFNFFSFQQNNLLKVFLRSYLFATIFAYYYFYMIEIIRAVRSIIPAEELTLLSLHMYLYSKPLVLVPYFANAAHPLP